MFSNGMKEGEQSQIEFKDISLDAFKTLLDYAYSGKIQISSSNVEVGTYYMLNKNVLGS